MSRFPYVPWWQIPQVGDFPPYMDTTPYYYDGTYPYPTFHAQGWECPKCGRVYAPAQACCLYCGNYTITTSTSAGITIQGLEGREDIEELPVPPAETPINTALVQKGKAVWHIPGDGGTPYG